MNKEKAVTEIYNTLYSHCNDKIVLDLAKKYGSGRVYLDSMENFDAFCKKRFPGQFLTVAWAVYDAAHYDNFSDSDQFFSWDEEKKEFHSSDDSILLLNDKYVFGDILEKAIKNNDPLLEPLNVNDEIRIIKDDLKLP